MFARENGMPSVVHAILHSFRLGDSEITEFVVLVSESFATEDFAKAWFNTNDKILPAPIAFHDGRCFFTEANSEKRRHSPPLLSRIDFEGIDRQYSNDSDPIRVSDSLFLQ